MVITNEEFVMDFIAPRNAPFSKEYTNGDPAKGIASSDVPPKMIGDIVNELITAIKAAGISPSSSSTKQLVQAITELIKKDASLIYMYNSLSDLLSYTGVKEDVKNVTLFKEALIKLGKMPSSFATDSTAGTIIIGKDFTISKTGVLTNNIITNATTNTSGVWSLSNLSLTKSVTIIHSGTGENATAKIKYISGVAPSTSTYVIGDGHSNSLTIYPKDKKIALDVELINSSLTAYQ